MNARLGYARPCKIPELKKQCRHKCKQTGQVHVHTHIQRVLDVACVDGGGKVGHGERGDHKSQSKMQERHSTLYYTPGSVYFTERGPLAPCLPYKNKASDICHSCSSTCRTPCTATQQLPSHSPPPPPPPPSPSLYFSLHRHKSKHGHCTENCTHTFTVNAVHGRQ